MDHKRKKIAIIANTESLDYDDRIRKECITLSRSADIEIFVNFSDNRKEQGTTSYGIPYRAFRIKSREKLPSSKFLLIKSIEYYLQVRKYLKEFDIIWANEEFTFLFAFLAPKGKIIWDLHEIPIQFEKSFIRKKIFQFIEKRCRFIIHANKYRIDYLYETGLILIKTKHHYIRNFPDHVFLNNHESIKDDSDFKKWLGNSEYVYLQGLSSKGRYPFNSVEAILAETDLKIIIIGRYEKSAKEKLLSQYGNLLNERVYFKGMVNQLDIPYYLRKSVFSIILYDSTIPNNRYCEPNRMYQAIALEVPVIVGKNEPMSELIDIYGFGIALNDDGFSLTDLKSAVKNIMLNRKMYLENIKKNKKSILWENQESIILETIKN